jgi:hypothetical protein
MMDGTAQPRRRGLSTVEVIGSLSLLMTVMATTIPLFVRHGRLLSDSRRERIAIEELANQAERLAAVPPADLDAYLADLVASPLARERLPAAELVASRGDSPLGERVILRLSWDAVGRREHPLSLAVWLVAPTGDVP